MRFFVFTLSFFLSLQAFSAQFYKQAQADSLKMMLTDQEGEEKIRTLIHLANCYFKMQLDSASNYATMAKIASQKLNYGWGEHKANYELIKVDIETNNLSETFQKLEKEYNWFNENGFQKDAIQCSIIKANFLHQISPIEIAKSHSYALLQEAKKIGTPDLLATSWYLYHFTQAMQLDGRRFQASLDSSLFYYSLFKDSLSLIKAQMRKYNYKVGQRESISYYLSLLPLAKRWNNTQLKQSLQGSLALSYGALGKSDSCYFFYQKKLASSRKYGSKLAIANTYFSMAYCSYKYFEVFSEAIEWGLESKNLREILGHDYQTYTSLRLLAEVYEKKKEYEAATLHYLEAHKIAKHLKHPYYINATLFSLAKMYSISKEPSKAENLYLKTISYAEQELKGRVKLLLLVAINTKLADLYIQKGRSEEALNLLEKTLDIALNVNQTQALDIAIRQMKIYIDLNETNKAEEAFINTKNYFKAFDKTYSANFHLQTGRLYFLKQRYNAAIVAVKAFLENSPQKEFSEDRKQAYWLLYKTYDQIGNAKLALQHHITFKNLSDSIKNVNSIENVALLQSKHEVLEKEAELLKSEQKKKIQELTIAKQDAELKEQKQDFLLTVFGFLLALSIGLLLFNRYRLGKEKRELALQSTQLSLEREKEKTTQQLAIAELRSDFFANISHELRTPLTLILGPLDGLLKRKNLDYRQDIERVQKNAKQLLSLVNETLDVSKLENGYLPLTINNTYIGAFVSKIANQFLAHAETKNIKLEVMDSSEAHQLAVDERKMSKILLNLISNAFKHTPSGGLVQVITEAPKNDMICIQVKDTGRGISTEDLPYIFDRFYQVDEDAEGSGIGLALSKQLIELHGGTILVKSSKGEGSTFIIQLPLIQTKQSETPSLNQKDEETLKLTANQLKLEQKTVLIIEDNTDLRLYLKQLLVEDYNVLLAADGEAGIKCAEENNPDLIVSDVMMPKKDGLTVSKYLKQNLATSHIPIILLTAKASLNSKIEGLETGADDYLSKPFYEEELLQRCKNLLLQRAHLRALFTANYFVSPNKLTQNKIDKEFLEKAEKIIEDQLDNPNFSVEQLCQELACNRTKVHRKLKALTGKNTSGFVKSIRLRKAALLLKEENLNVNEIYEIVGFGSRETFNKAFKAQFKLTPTDFRKNENPVPLT